MISITTLTERSDFVRLRRGRKFVAPWFILRALPSDSAGQSGARIGYTVTTKCGNAVIRNRIKRRFRAIVAEIFPQSARAGYDYILIALDSAKPSAADAPFAEMKEALAKALERVHA